MTYKGKFTQKLHQINAKTFWKRLVLPGHWKALLSCQCLPEIPGVEVPQTWDYKWKMAVPAPAWHQAGFVKGNWYRTSSNTFKRQTGSKNWMDSLAKSSCNKWIIKRTAAWPKEAPVSIELHRTNCLGDGVPQGRGRILCGTVLTLWIC